MADGAVHDGVVVAGYYRMRDRAGKWQPVAIWKQDGELVCRVGPDMRPPSDVWLWCAKHRMPKDDVLYAFEHGRWRDEVPPALGDNVPPGDDPFEELNRELEAEAARVRAWVAEPHDGATEANRAANWLDALRKLEKRIVDAFNAEKEPVLKETQRIDSKWRDSKRTAAEIKKLMDDCYQAIGRRERKRLQDLADQKAREEAEALRKQREADAAAQAELARMHNLPVDLPEPEVPITAVAAAPVKAAFGGANGARIGLKKVPPKGVVEDWAKVAVFYSNHSKLREVVEKLITHDLKDGRTEIPGVRIVPGE